jgi:hypothetical protein
MAEEQLVPPTQNTLPNTPEVLFTSPASGAGTLITSVVASNDTAADRTYMGYIVSDATAGTLPQVPIRTVVKRKTDVPPELTGQVIPPGGTLQFESSVASSIAFTVTGRNLT